MHTVSSVPVRLQEEALTDSPGAREEPSEQGIISPYRACRTVATESPPLANQTLAEKVSA